MLCYSRMMKDLFMDTMFAAKPRNNKKPKANPKIKVEKLTEDDKLRHEWRDAQKE